MRSASAAALVAFVDAFEARLEAAHREDVRAAWDRRAPPGLTAKLLGEPTARARIFAAAETAAAGEDGDARVPRLAAKLRRAQLATRTASAEQAVIAARTRADGGGDGARLAVLRGDPDRARREQAWRARATVGAAIAAPLAALGRARRDAAVELTGEPYVTLARRLDELDDTGVARACAVLEAATREPWRTACAIRRDALGVDALAPWDLHLRIPGDEDRAAADAPAIVRAAGFTADEIIIAGDADASATFVIDAPRDVRVRLRAGAGVREALHELGHALYATHLDPALPFLLREPPAPCLDEAVATRFAHLAGPRGFAQLAEARMLLVLIEVERVLHEGAPDLDARYWDGVARVLELDVARARSAPAWARVGHFITHPMHLANYAIAEELAPELSWPTLANRVLRHGARVGWRPLNS